MYLTPAQIKGRIKNVAKQNGSDPITLLRIYMMERFLERITYSKYKDDFIVKGGILVTSMIGSRCDRLWILIQQYVILI